MKSNRRGLHVKVRPKSSGHASRRTGRLRAVPLAALAVIEAPAAVSTAAAAAPPNVVRAEPTGVVPAVRLERRLAPTRGALEKGDAGVAFEPARAVVAAAPAAAASPDDVAAPVGQDRGFPRWMWPLLALILLAAAFAFRRRRKQDPVITTRSSMGDPNNKTRR